VEAVEAMRGAPGDLEHVCRLALLAVGHRCPDSWLAQVVPGGLDKQPACVARAGLGDRALAAALAGLIERRYQSEPGAEASRESRPSSALLRATSPSTAASVSS
jgi:hypothetical protein